MLFVDWQNGDALHVTGTASVHVGDAATALDSTLGSCNICACSRRTCYCEGLLPSAEDLR